MHREPASYQTPPGEGHWHRADAACNRSRHRRRRHISSAQPIEPPNTPMKRISVSAKYKNTSNVDLVSKSLSKGVNMTDVEKCTARYFGRNQFGTCQRKFYFLS